MRSVRWLLSVVVLVVAVAGTGCPHRVAGVDVSTLTHESVRARLQQSAERRASMQGVIKARLPGLEGVVVNATIDVAGRAPGDLFVAVRSFFEVPQQVLVARQNDGASEVTLYDATSGAPHFFRGPGSEKTLQRVLGVPLAPDDVVALLLARPPLDGRPGWPLPRVRLIGVDEDAGTYTAQIERAGRGPLVVVVDARTDTLLQATVLRGDGRKLVAAVFEAPRAVAGVVFAGRVKLTVIETGQQLVLEVQEATWNEAIADEAFKLDPPDGMTLEPL